jgi:hypothetical protein
VSSPGSDFAQALFAKDFDRIREVVDPAIDFRALTPRRIWEPADADELIDGVLKVWFDDSAELERLADIDTGEVGDRERVAYRFEGRNSEGRFVVEQQAYYEVSHERISWMRVMCSGFRPPDLEA